MLLRVGGAGAGGRIPDDPVVVDVMLRVLRIGDNRTDQRRYADCPYRGIDDVARVLVTVRVDVGGVLRPDDDVRLGYRTGRDECGQPLGLVGVVGKHLLRLTEE